MPSDKVFFDASAQCFKKLTSQGKKYTLKGLKPQLKKLFWPDYQFVKYKTDVGKSTGVSRPWMGVRRGSTVHRQIEKSIKTGKAPTHRYAIKALKALQLYQWKPLTPEVTTYDPPTNVATKMDLLCKDETTGELVGLDWKTGQDYYLNRGNAQMHGPITISNSPLHQAIYQQIFSCIFYENQFQEKVHQAYVVHIHQKGVRRYNIAKEFPDIWKRRAELYAYFVTSLQK